MNEFLNPTPLAQHLLFLARKEADRCNRDSVGTEHLLLGLINLGQGVAVNVLRKMGLELETLRTEVEKAVGLDPEDTVKEKTPYTPGTRCFHWQPKKPRH